MLISHASLVAALALLATLWAVTGPQAAAQEVAAGRPFPTPLEGPKRGERFDDTPRISDMTDTRVARVLIHHEQDSEDDVIYGIQMIHDEEELEFHGDRWGTEEEFFDLEANAAEYITGISGTYSENHGIQSLYIHYASYNDHEQMSKRFGVLGFDQEDYKLKCPLHYEVAGFHGRTDGSIDAIGLICRPRPS